jgi:hypothetical protein
MIYTNNNSPMNNTLILSFLFRSPFLAVPVPLLEVDLHRKYQIQIENERILL